ncbi:MAG: DUF6880 family protein [Chlamydiia bacterium]
MATCPITVKTLESLAGGAAFERGRAYYKEGVVENARPEPTAIAATVVGSSRYKVKLLMRGNALESSCTCPQGRSGCFCKHCVAVGLAWLAAPDLPKDPVANVEKPTGPDPWAILSEYLAKQPQEVLAKLLMDMAVRDERFQQELLRRAIKFVHPSDERATYLKAITKITKVNGFLDYKGVRAFAPRFQELLDELEELLTVESASMLIDLAEHATERIEQLLGKADDSNGSIGGLLHDCIKLHLRACQVVRPEPIQLAEKLFRRIAEDQWGVFLEHLKSYQGVLGPTGLQRCQELADAEWEQITSITTKGTQDSRRWNLSRLVEGLAEMTGDIEKLVAIKSRDLSSPWNYFTISTVYAEAGYQDKALDWAERGLRAFPDQVDDHLSNFLVAEYLKCGRSEEAVELTWAQFKHRPGLMSYQKLHEVATAVERWPEQRERALQWMSSEKAAAKVQGRWAPSSSVRMEIALWEEDLDAAMAVVRDGPTPHSSLLIRLAKKLEATRPTEAIELYLQVVEPIIETTGQASYEAAVKLIRQIGKLMKAHELAKEFEVYLAELRTKFKAKRNFIQLLSAVK